METLRLRRARFIAVLLTTSLLIGLLYGFLLVWLDLPDALFSWWGTALRAVIAVVVCLGITSAVDRRWARR